MNTQNFCLGLANSLVKGNVKISTKSNIFKSSYTNNIVMLFSVWFVDLCNKICYVTKAYYFQLFFYPSVKV